MDVGGSLKHYKLLSRLGEGGMGIVYRAKDTRLGRTVALKMLPPEMARDGDRLRRFEREAHLASAISHPGVATLFDFDREGDVAFLTMELVKGPNLRELLEQGTLDPGRVLECAVQVAEAMAAAHAEGVVHRDLKPENVVAADAGYYKVLDFGVARRDDLTNSGEQNISDTQADTVEPVTRAGTLLGTVAYMSPEQIQGQPVDPRSDIFSFGCLLYELCTGTAAFRRKTEIATAHAILHEQPVPMSTVRPGLPPGLEMVVNKCLGKDVADRYQRSEELVLDLRAIRLGGLSGTRTLRNLRAYNPSRPNWRRWALALPLVALVAVALWSFAPRIARLAPAPDHRPPFDAPGGFRGPGPPAAFAARQSTRPRLVVASFVNNSGDPQADWLSRGLPEMMTTDLSRSDALDVIATQRLYDLLAIAGKDKKQMREQATAMELARWVGADIVISGSVFRAGERYRIDAQAYDTATGTVSAAEKVEGTDLFQMVDGLTRGLLDGLQMASTTGRESQVAVSTSSEEAFRSFSEGKNLFGQLRFEAAADEFQKAIDIDPDFATARLRLGLSRLMAGRPKEALPRIDEAYRVAEKMPERERLLTRAVHAFFRDRDLESGGAIVDELLRLYPEDHEAPVWQALAWIRLEGDPLRATRILRRTLDSDPNNLPAIAALAEQLAGLGALEAAESILLEAAGRNPEAATQLNRLIDSYSPDSRAKVSS